MLRTVNIPVPLFSLVNNIRDIFGAPEDSLYFADLKHCYSKTHLNIFGYDPRTP